MGKEILKTKLENLKIGEKFKYNTEDIGIYKVLRKVDENWIESVKLQSGRIAGSFPWLEVYPINGESEVKPPKLTLEHLSPYLPYGIPVKVHDLLGNYLFTDNISIELLHRKQLSQLTPILRPISEITVDFFKENIDDAIVDFLINCEPENNHFSVEVCEKVIGWSALSYEEYQLFFKNHFDVFGLIDRGLAISTDTLGKEVKGEQ